MRLPKFAERQPLEHDVGEAAIGRRVAAALLGDDQRIGGLAVRRRCRCGQLTPVRSSGLPSAQMRLTWPIGAFAQADGEIGEIAVGRRGRRDGAPRDRPCRRRRRVGSVRLDLLELRRPDHLAGDAHAAVDARDRRALGRGHHVEVGRAAGPATCASCCRRRAARGRSTLPASAPTRRPAIAPTGPNTAPPAAAPAAERTSAAISRSLRESERHRRAAAATTARWRPRRRAAPSCACTISSAR